MAETTDKEIVRNVSVPGTTCWRCRNSGTIHADHYMERACPDCEKGVEIREQYGTGQF